MRAPHNKPRRPIEDIIEHICRLQPGGRHHPGILAIVKREIKYLTKLDDDLPPKLRNSKQVAEDARLADEAAAVLQKRLQKLSKNILLTEDPPLTRLTGFGLGEADDLVLNCMPFVLPNGELSPRPVAELRSSGVQLKRMRYVLGWLTQYRGPDLHVGLTQRLCADRALTLTDHGLLSHRKFREVASLLYEAVSGDYVDLQHICVEVRKANKAGRRQRNRRRVGLAELSRLAGKVGGKFQKNRKLPLS